MLLFIGFKQFGVRKPDLKFWVLDAQSYDGVIKPDSFVVEVHVPPTIPERSPMHTAMQKSIVQMATMPLLPLIDPDLSLMKTVLSACVTAAGPQGPTQQLSPSVQVRNMFDAMNEEERMLSEAINAASLLHVVIANTLTNQQG